jgi:CRISPR-associated protein Cas2
MYLIAYDITDAKRLRKLAKLLETHGVRAQYSIFELKLPREEVEKLITEIEKTVDPDEGDKVYVYPISGKEKRTRRKGRKKNIWEMIF